jgi:platelet-activating factor acetylhydrolase IB subunit beta/gamma
MKPKNSPLPKKLLLSTSIALSFFTALSAVSASDTPYSSPEPQKTGWPLSEAERSYILTAEHERRPGKETHQHLPALWPVVPSAGFWGGSSWLDVHSRLVTDTQARKGPIDCLLVGDSITMQWGAAWQKHFGQYKSVNIGIGGDKTQNVLWRLDHGGVTGIRPKAIVLMIGNNNMFFSGETGIEPIAKGIQTCASNLLEKFPSAHLFVVKILPAHAPGNPFYEDIKRTNTALDSLQLSRNPQIHILDLWNDVTQPDGTLKAGIFTPDNIHLTQEGGYELYASKLKPLLEPILAKID